MTTNNNTPKQNIDALTAIRLRKVEVQNQIKASHQQIKATFDGLFKPVPKPTSKFGQLVGIMDQGFAIFEGLTLGLRVIRGIRHLFGRKR